MSFTQNKRYKKCALFSFTSSNWSQFYFTFANSYMNCCKVLLSKSAGEWGGGFSIFDSISLLLKFIFLFNKKHILFDFKCRNSFQNQNNWKATHTLSWDMKLWNPISAWLEFPKNWSGDQFFNSRKLIFEKVSFFP